MTIQSYYDKAPIVEAIIDLRISTDVEQDSLAALNSLAKILESEFALQAVIHQQNFSIHVEPTATRHESSHKLEGYRFFSSSKLNLMTVGLTGFTYSRVRPYNGWENFRTEARQQWDRYRDILKPAKITRTDVRYINRIDVPISDRVEDYLRIFAQLPPDFPQGNPDGSFLQLQIPQRDIESMLVVNQAWHIPETAGAREVILDFDLVCQLPYDIQQEDEVWVQLEKMRERKNHVFEACITQKTREAIL